MRHTMRLALTLPALALLFAGCGAVDDDFQAGNRLIVTKVADSSGSTAPVFLAVEETDDSGPDGDPSTATDNNPGFPDEGEQVITALGPDMGVVALKNEPRLGVDPGVDLTVFEVVVTYRDAFGRAQAFAPQQFYYPTLLVPTGEAVDLDVLLVPEQMKKDEDGLRDVFLYGSEDDKAAVSTMTAIVDVYAKDALNNRTAHAQGRIPLTFINPLTSAQPQ